MLHQRRLIPSLYMRCRCELPPVPRSSHGSDRVRVAYTHARQPGKGAPGRRAPVRCRGAAWHLRPASVSIRRQGECVRLRSVHGQDRSVSIEKIRGDMRPAGRAVRGTWGLLQPVSGSVQWICAPVQMIQDAVGPSGVRDCRGSIHLQAIITQVQPLSELVPSAGSRASRSSGWVPLMDVQVPAISTQV